MSLQTMTVDYSKSCTAPVAGRMDLLCQGLRTRHKLTGRGVREGKRQDSRQKEMQK